MDQPPAPKSDTPHLKRVNVHKKKRKIIGYQKEIISHLI